MRKKVLLNLIFVLIVFIIVLTISSGNIIDEFKPILVENNDKITDPIIISFEGYEMIFPSWASFVVIDKDNKRLIGTKSNGVSYFYYEEDNKIIGKERVYWYNNTKDPRKIGYKIKNPGFNPYLRLEMFVETEGETEKGGYGFNLNKFDVYLPNGMMLKNDYNNVDGNLTGTNYKNEVKYEIFYNENDVIIIAGDFDYIENLFRWEVFRPWFSKQENGVFSPLYIIYVKDVKELKYEDNTWMIKSKQFTGNVEEYIEEVKKDLSSQ